MKRFEDLTIEEKKEIYKETLSNNGYYDCCCGEKIPFEEMDGICPDCGCATANGYCIFSCGYSPCVCKTCESCPCDGSC